MTDENLMLHVRDGNLDLASQLYDRYNIIVYNFFLHLCFNKELSQDLMQNVFFRIIKYRRSYKPGHMFRSWIFRIARNVFSDHMKRNSALQSNFIDLDDLNLSVDSRIDDLEKAERIKNLQTALTMIPREHREVLILKEYQRLKYKEIADILNCSENTVKGKVFRAISSLRKAFFTMENK
ncbi:MAG: sigma-70 family RNA polymerase sigma factor [Bacteroidales bacterium]|nr:MAG: sigma-70 family RNA polymerase sigma factor [Bacteroidales bacterium]